MSTDTVPTGGATAPPVSTGVPDGPTDPGERGTLTVADRVVERIAGYAVTFVDAATAAPRRMLGVKVGDARPDDRPHVDASVEGATATVSATIAVRWPASVRSVCEQTRYYIREEVFRITGVRVDHIDIDVASMTVPTKPAPRVR